jgi:hypothetical protein
MRRDHMLLRHVASTGRARRDYPEITA